MYWAILRKAGYSVDEALLRQIAPVASRYTYQFNPGFANRLRDVAWNLANSSVTDEPQLPTPPAPRNLAELQAELQVINRFRREQPGDTNINGVFDADDIVLLEFLDPIPGRSGSSVIQPYRMYHAPNAGDFITEILDLLDKGLTVILDLGNANDEVRRYFSDNLSRAIFSHQESKFTDNDLGNHFIQIYFEEAQNLFPTEEDETSIYTRFAREGAKFHIGIVYSTQSPTAISKTLLEQTENFFVAHLSSQEQVKALGRVNVVYESFMYDILHARTRGYMRMLTRSHRFVISVQAKQFVAPAPTTGTESASVAQAVFKGYSSQTSVDKNQCNSPVLQNTQTTSEPVNADGKNVDANNIQF